MGMAPGVLVDREAGSGYAADAAGFLQALSLRDGSVRWISGEQAFPLAERDGQLYALGRVEAKGSGSLLVLDPRNGALLDRIAFDVPEHVAATVMPHPAGRFTISAVASANGLRLDWRHESRALRGALLDGDEAPRVDAGAFELLAASGRSVLMPILEPGTAPAQPSPEVAPGARLAGVAGRQFRSVGDDAVLGSEAVADPTWGTAWRWTIRARAAERAAGELLSPYSFAPFVLLDDTLVYRSEPFAFSSANGAEVSQRARLVGYDLAAGRELWHLDVLDPVFRGPLPP
jgi:hypothetical protein